MASLLSAVPKAQLFREFDNGKVLVLSSQDSTSNVWNRHSL